MNYIIFDLEASCWEGRNLIQNETIEIGAVKINAEKEIVDEFVQFIKPLKHPILSDFCKELTSIRQKDIDNAPFFDIAIEKFKKWINLEEDYILCSWGVYDKRQFKSDHELWGLNADWVKKHISIKHQHGKICNLKRAIGMKNALIYENFKLDGTHHRGIDDARNISKIFIKHFDKWDFNNFSK